MLTSQELLHKSCSISSLGLGEVRIMIPVKPDTIPNTFATNSPTLAGCAASVITPA